MHSIMHPMTCYDLFSRSQAAVRRTVGLYTIYLGSGTGELPVHVGRMKLVKQGRKEWADELVIRWYSPEPDRKRSHRDMLANITLPNVEEMTLDREARLLAPCNIDQFSHPFTASHRSLNCRGWARLQTTDSAVPR